MHKACFVSFTGCPGIAPTSGSGPSPLGDTKDTVKEMLLCDSACVCALLVHVLTGGYSINLKGGGGRMI